MTKRIAAGLVALTVLIAGACSNDDDGDGEGQARTVETTTTTTTAAGDGDNNGGDQESDVGAPLSEVVLQLSDMPTGYSPAPPEEDPDDPGDDLECLGEDPFLEDEGEPIEEAESAFQESDFGPFVSALASRYDDSDIVDTAIDTIANGFPTCDGFTDVDDEGTETTYTVSPLSFPALGDDTFAGRLSAASPVGPITIDLIITRVDKTALLLFNVGIGGVDTELSEQLMRTMVDRA